MTVPRARKMSTCCLPMTPSRRCGRRSTWSTPQRSPTRSRPARSSTPGTPSTATRAGATATRRSSPRSVRCAPSCASCSRPTATERPSSSTRCSPRPAHSRSSCATTGSTGTSTPCRPTRHSIAGSSSRARWRWSTSSASTSSRACRCAPTSAATASSSTSRATARDASAARPAPTATPSRHIAPAAAAAFRRLAAMISRSDTYDAVQAEELHGAHNYAPLPVVLSRGEGVWVHDVEGRRYFDALSAYSALNFGHRHPRLVRAATEQLERLTLTSRAFHNDQLGPFCAELATYTETDRVLPMNTGAEAVETGIKLARKWGYERKDVEPERAEIVVCAGNFHGRTTTIVGFSDDPLARTGFGPFGPGFVTIPYGDSDSLRAAVGV